MSKCGLVLDFPVHMMGLAEAVNELQTALEREIRVRVVTLNPEMIMLARRNQKLAWAIRRADLTVPDGTGVVWALRLAGFKGQERVGGVDLVEEFIRATRNRGIKIFLLGGEPGVAAEASRRMKSMWPWVQVVGAAHGYHSSTDDERLVGTINSSGPDLLLVGMGLPKQEIWLAENWERLDVPVGIGVGGGIDLWAGRTKRAPGLLRRLGLEWLYRALREPWRFSRLRVLPLFVWTVMRSRRNGSTGSMPEK